MKKLLLGICLLISFSMYGQYIPENLDYTMVYDLVDELANDGVIEINSAVKPYSREFIANALQTAQRNPNVNPRQLKEIKFYLDEFSLERDTLPAKTYGKLVRNDKSSLALIEPAYRYKDELFRAKISPIIGMDVSKNESGSYQKRWYGAELQAMIGKHFSFYASLRDVSQEKILLAYRQYYNVATKSPFTGNDTSVTKSGYISNMMGGAYKLNGTGGGDYSEMRCGIYYSWKWGHIGFAKDQITFGDAYNGSNILSGNTPTFPFIKLNLKPAKWIELNYMHAWLVSMVADSSQYYVENTGEKAYWYKHKYMAANMLTIKPIDKFSFSIGNSIIYSEDNINVAYLIPFAFYKSIDETITRDQTENQNSQVFFNISSRNIKHLHLYTSIYVDEFSYKRLTNSQSNPISYKFGFRLSNYPVQNLTLTGEYTRNQIITYKNSIPSIDYTSNGYLLGSYLGDNAQEFYLALQYRPVSRLQMKLSYTFAEKGNDYQYFRSSVDETLAQPFMKDVVWKNNTLSFKTTYELFRNAYATVQLDYSNIKAYDVSGDLTIWEVWKTAQEYLNMYTPAYLQGKKTTLTLGFSYGF
ncbi:MAG: capsule assembly Wzi family protein [Paludibacteraceae bacterium]|nr:capsule assembly Wzi family protein [Paludibacteraceae bacterium]